MPRPTSDSRNVSVRLDAATIARIDALVLAMRAATGIEVDASQVYRAALCAGLDTLEQRGKR